MHIGIYSQMNPDLLSGNSIQNSYLVHEASGLFARNSIPSLPTTEGAKESERAREKRQKARDRRGTVSISDYTCLGNPVFSREFSCLVFVCLVDSVFTDPESE